MASSEDRPHLNLLYRGNFEPKYKPSPFQNPEAEKLKANRNAHASNLRGLLKKIRDDDAQLRHLRATAGLPAIPADKGFVVKVPENVDSDALAAALGVELVAETSQGLMLVTTTDLSFKKLEDVLTRFELSQVGGGSAVSLFDIFTNPEDDRRLDEILSEEVRGMWPFVDDKMYVFDIGIQTAQSTRLIVKWPKGGRKKGESQEEFKVRRAKEKQEAMALAGAEWDEKADERYEELNAIASVAEYHGELLSGIVSDPVKEDRNGMLFPDSFQVRAKMNGKGFKDVIHNLAHIFEISSVPDVEQYIGTAANPDENSTATVTHPEDNAPAVCIIDSGIQENHNRLSAAIDNGTSKCFIPGIDEKSVADEVKPAGHGTGVAGAVLFPYGVPTTGQVQPVAWIQNARVLGPNCRLPEDLPPERYLHEAVTHFQASDRATKIFNHSISTMRPCPRRRMTAWAAKIDDLSHERDVLFIQPAGNLYPDAGTMPDPGVRTHLQAGKVYPEYLLTESSCRIASPGQSLHALTVGAIASTAYEDSDWISFSKDTGAPASYTRSGFAAPWGVVKPEVVEFGGDYVQSKAPPYLLKKRPETSVEVLNTTLFGAPAVSRDGTGTSFAAPKVAHLAARIQRLFPKASPLLYRALIVNSAQWPEWAEKGGEIDKSLRLVGYGVPSSDKALSNSPSRVTLVMPDASLISNGQYHLYTIPIPEEMRGAAVEARIRVDITLAYTATPRRTRSRHRGYLETWLDWESSRVGEPLGDFRIRMETGVIKYKEKFNWKLDSQNNWGESAETNRTRGSVQKDWAVFDAYNLPDEFSIAVRSHTGWNHRPEAAWARYCLVASFEVIKGELPVYQMIEAAIEQQLSAGDVEVPAAKA